jgi:hypothetical protein
LPKPLHLKRSPRRPNKGLLEEPKDSNASPLQLNKLRLLRLQHRPQKTKKRRTEPVSPALSELGEEDPSPS